LDENYLVVRDAKNRTERMVPISQSLFDICKQYVFYREKLPLKIDRESFFLSLSRRRCKGKHTIHRWFKLVLKDAGIPYTGNHHGPKSERRHLGTQTEWQHLRWEWTKPLSGVAGLTK
jgi:site-specific recombinase XerD